MRLLDLNAWHNLNQEITHRFEITIGQLTLGTGFHANYLRIIAIRPHGATWLVKEDQPNRQPFKKLLHSPFKWCVNNYFLSRICSNKITGDGFQGANECLDDEKVYLTFKANGTTTPFIYKWQSLKELFDNF